MVNLILSIVNAVLACGLLAAILVNEKRTKKRFEDMTRYVNYGDSQLAKAMQELKEELSDAFTEETAKVKEELHEKLETLANTAHDADEELLQKINEALSEINPNFEAAKLAVSRVNDLGASLMSLFSYDPAEAMKKSRDGERGGEA